MEFIIIDDQGKLNSGPYDRRQLNRRDLYYKTGRKWRWTCPTLRVGETCPVKHNVQPPSPPAVDGQDWELEKADDEYWDYQLIHKHQSQAKLWLKRIK